MGVLGKSSATPGSVIINEFTTVAGAWALAQFTDSTGQTIDASGNVWVTNLTTDSMAEIIGVAGAVLTPLEACLAQATPKAMCLP